MCFFFCSFCFKDLYQNTQCWLLDYRLNSSFLPHSSVTQKWHRHRDVCVFVRPISLKGSQVGENTRVLCWFLYVHLIRVPTRRKWLRWGFWPTFYWILLCVCVCVNSGIIGFPFRCLGTLQLSRFALAYLTWAHGSRPSLPLADLQWARRVCSAESCRPSEDHSFSILPCVQFHLLYVQRCLSFWYRLFRMAV